MPEVNEVIYAKHMEHGGHHCTYIVLSINHDMEFLVVWSKHPRWGEQVIPHSLPEEANQRINLGLAM
eukprot:15164014-Ditylum_brightwellii.AAC.1